MLHGKGTQNFLSKSYEDDRRDLLEDSTDATTSEKEEYEITGADGGGRTNSDTYEIKQHPFPADTTIKSRKTIDVRKAMPELGEMSDV